jgi:putative ABC transport system permease protein
MISLTLPAFGRLVQRPLALADLGRGFFPFYLGGITLLVGLAAGCYPALFLSSFKPQATIKGWLAARSKSHVFMRRGLVLVQFVIGFAVIFGTGVVFRQVHYLKNQTLGFDQDQVVVIHRAKALGTSADAFDRELLSHPEILEVSRSESLPGRHFDPNGHRLEGWPASKDTTLMTTYVDPRFANLLGLNVIDGRFFSPEIPSDATSAVVINERAARELGLSEAVGKRLHKEYGGAKEGEFVTIIGVLGDFHFDSLHRKIQPMLLRFLSPDEWGYTSVKVRPERLPQTLSLIERTWAAFTGGQPLEYSFLDEDFGALYDSERRAGKTLAIFSTLAILVACLGLYGLISFAAEQRMREIGIRKTFGASVANLTGLLSKEVVFLVSAAVLISSLPAYYFTQNWLKNFAFRIGVSPLMFIAAALAILAVAVLSIAVRAFRAAAANPIDTLRYE